MNYRKTIAVLMGMSLSVGMLTGCAQQDAGLGMLLVNPMPVARAFDDKTSTAPSTVDAYPVDMTYTQYAVLEEVAVEEPAATEPEATQAPQAAQAPAGGENSGGGHSSSTDKDKTKETKPASEDKPEEGGSESGETGNTGGDTSGGNTAGGVTGGSESGATGGNESGTTGGNEGNTGGGAGESGSGSGSESGGNSGGGTAADSGSGSSSSSGSDSSSGSVGGSDNSSGGGSGESDGGDSGSAENKALSVRNISGTSKSGAPQWVVFRYQEQGHENVYHYQLVRAEDVRAEDMRVVTCVTTDGKVVWETGIGDETEEPPRLEAMILQENVEWKDCSADGVYAVNQQMQFSTVMGDLEVLYADYQQQNGQMQFYSEDGDLLECWSVSAMPPEAKLMESVDVDWSPNTHVELKVDALVMGETGQLGKIPQLSGLTQKKTAKLPAWSVAVMVVLAVAAVGLALAVILLLKRKPAKAQKRVPEKVQEQPVSSGPKVAALHNIGRRSGQQDSFDVVPCAGGLLAVVADGMGGLSDGDKVSKKIVSTFHEDAARVRPGQSFDALYQMLAHANQEVNRMLGTSLQGKCGSTLLAVLMEKDRMQWTAVGDSRIYLYRGGSLIQVNREHTYKIDLLERAINGEMSFADLRKDAQLTRLCSYMGMGRIKHVDGSLNTVRLLPGDRVLLMSDGVFNTLSEEEIAGVLSRFDDVEQAAAVLEKKVLEKNSPTQDNFTCVILKP